MPSFLKSILSILAVVILLPLIPVMTNAVTSLYYRHFDQKAAVAVVPIRGVLHDSATTVRQLQAFFKDPTIKAIVLKIECNGSTTGTGQTIFYELQALKKEYKKPVIALTENICVSGGYYIACAADHIITSGSALVGSIGVCFNQMSQFGLKDFIEQFKIKYDGSAAGDYKLAGDLFVEHTPEHKKMLQSILDDSYNQFVDDVAASRNISTAQAKDWANGKVFTGRQAQKLGLVDQLGATSTAIAVVKEKALIEGEIRWVYPVSGRGGLMRLITGDEDDDHGLMSKMVNECCTIIEQRYCQHQMV